jgi:2-amino-4-hydroxy-6-hydroxymethyldihydropteridine diphosphokinase
VTELSPRELLQGLQVVERALGRTPLAERWGPRVLDLDVLFVVGESLDEPLLSVPHPRLGERAFALAPLLDVFPEAADPRTGEPYAERLRQLGREGIQELTGTRAGAWMLDRPPP